MCELDSLNVRQFLSPWVLHVGIQIEWENALAVHKNIKKHKHQLLSTLTAVGPFYFLEESGAVEVAHKKLLLNVQPS